MQLVLDCGSASVRETSTHSNFLQLGLAEAKDMLHPVWQHMEFYRGGTLVKQPSVWDSKLTPSPDVKHIFFNTVRTEISIPWRTHCSFATETLFRAYVKNIFKAHCKCRFLFPLFAWPVSKIQQGLRCIFLS